MSKKQSKSSKAAANKVSKQKPAARQRASAASRADGAVIPVGKAAPAFKLPDQRGKPRQLKDYRGRWVVLYFYPKDNTTGCTKQACQFRDSRARFDRADAVVIGVSPDDVKSHEKFAGKFNLPFILLADDGAKVCEKYGVWREKSMYGRKYMGVVRTTYLIDPAGKIAHRWDKVKVPGHEDDVLAKLPELSG